MAASRVAATSMPWGSDVAFGDKSAGELSLVDDVAAISALAMARGQGGAVSLRLGYLSSQASASKALGPFGRTAPHEA